MKAKSLALTVLSIGFLFTSCEKTWNCKISTTTTTNGNSTTTYTNREFTGTPERVVMYEQAGYLHLQLNDSTEIEQKTNCRNK